MDFERKRTVAPASDAKLAPTSGSAIARTDKPHASADRTDATGVQAQRSHRRPSASSHRQASQRLARPSKPQPRAPAPAPPSANANGGFSLSRQLGLGVARIVIDPGHGGHDPGAKARGTRRGRPRARRRASARGAAEGGRRRGDHDPADQHVRRARGANGDRQPRRRRPVPVDSRERQRQRLRARRRDLLPQLRAESRRPKPSPRARTPAGRGRCGTCRTSCRRSRSTTRSTSRATSRRWCRARSIRSCGRRTRASGTSA